MPNLCNAAACAKLALDKVVCDAVSNAALNFYTQVVEFLRNTLCIDLTVFFQLIAMLAVICWIQNWLIEIIHFICRIPKVLKNLFCGNFNLCLLDCDGSENNSTKSNDSGSDDY
jgi:hypothetical protein